MTRQRNDVTTRDPAHLCSRVNFVSVFSLFWGFGKDSRHFLMEYNFLTLIDHFSKTNGILMLYLLVR